MSILVSKKVQRPWGGNGLDVWRRERSSEWPDGMREREREEKELREAVGPALWHLAWLWPVGFINLALSEPGSHWTVLKGKAICSGYILHSSWCWLTIDYRLGWLGRKEKNSKYDKRGVFFGRRLREGNLREMWFLLGSLWGGQHAAGSWIFCSVGTEEQKLSVCLLSLRLLNSTDALSSYCIHGSMLSILERWFCLSVCFLHSLFSV